MAEADIESDVGQLQQDSEITDEQQDWRFLSQLTSSNGANQLPRRGEKDFEPDGTGYQERMLQESRNAMYQALQGERKHAAKAHVSAVWHPNLGLASVAQPRGAHFKTTGKADSKGTLWLLPEELIYLVERGSIESWWPQGLPMTVQAVYAACLRHCNGLEFYQTYAYLRRAGFIVQRAPSFDYQTALKDYKEALQLEKYPSSSLISILSDVIYSGLAVFRRVGFLSNMCSLPIIDMKSHEECLIFTNTIWGKGNKRKKFSSYPEIYRLLQIIPCHSPIRDATLEPPDEIFRVFYHVWKPRPTFKKTNPGDPDFRIVVVNARQQRMPTLAQLSRLFNSFPINPNMAEKPYYEKLKQGHRQAILAIVDAGVISFTTFGDVGFGDEPIYNRISYGSDKGKSRPPTKATNVKK